MPNNELSITANKGVHAGEEARYLLDDREHAPELKFGFCKGNFKSNGNGLEIKINVKSGPIWVTSYGIKSANARPNRDPKKWDFIARNNKGQERVLHSENSESRKWAHRWSWWD